MDVRTAAGESVMPRVRKTRALLAMLALAAPRPLLRQTVCETLWSRRDRDQARASLRQSVHELQEHLAGAQADLLQASRDALGFRLDGVWVDAREVLRASPSNPAALGLLQGALLEELDGLDIGFDRWLATERQRLTRAARAVAEAVLAQLGPAGEPGLAIAAAEQLLAIDRTHEGAWRTLMRAHAQRGERSLALDAFERAATALAEAGQATPAAETVDLLARVRDGTDEFAPSSAVSSTGGGGSVPGAAGPDDVAPDAGPRALRPLPAEPPMRSERGVRLGVMPFRSLDPDGDEHLGLGLAEEITTALAGFRMITLLSSTSLAHLAHQPREGSAAWARLDLDFLLTGTVQRGGGRVRILARLLDFRAAGEVVWTRRFEREAGDVLVLQDDIAAEVAAQIDPELLLQEGRRVGARAHADPASIDPTAHDLLLRAIPSIYHLDRAQFLLAGQALADAVAREPNYAAARAWWAYWHVFLVGQGWAEDPTAAIARAGELAERAITLDPSDARALTIAGHVRSFLHHQHAEAMVLHDRALSLNPNLPAAWVFSGLAQAYLGHHDDAIRRILRAKQLSPFDPHTFFFDSALMVPHLLRGDFQAAIEICRRVIELHPGLSTTYKGYLVALGHLGRGEEAAGVRERLLRLEPLFNIRSALTRSPLARPEDRSLYADGLRLSGLPEEPPEEEDA